MSSTMNAETVDVLLDKFYWKILNVTEAVALVNVRKTLSKQKTL